MVRLKYVVLWFAFLVAAPSAASDRPIIAPVPDWVQSLDLPKPDAARAGTPAQALLMSSQARYGEEDIHYLETATLIQHPQALTALGNIAIPWQPDRAELRIHKVHIVRGGKVEDVLAKGQSFTVLRRENNLESATLDGVLTAALQPEGLSVGDVLNIAFSIRSKPHSLGLKAENLVSLNPGTRTRRLFLREIWPSGDPFAWKATEMIGTPELRRSGSGTELVLDRTDIDVPVPPSDAPRRYLLPAVMEVSEYRDWGEIAGLLAPSYDAASTLGPASPLREEARRIAAASADPGERAMAALRLVQDKIRYLALQMGDAGYVPATADQTWSRKYGDCKGKTATLLALLAELGIDAEPVLVNTAIGDMLPQRLPQIAVFDHVIVRARIGGRSYWLDGTRSGDRRLAELGSSPFRWGLPVRASGASLEQLPLLPPTQPLIETNITHDASAGLLAPAPFKGEMVFRGDAATIFSLALAQAGPEELEKKAREQITTLPESDDLRLDFVADDQAGTFTIRFSGTRKMEWKAPASSRQLSFRFSDDAIEWEPEFEREPGPFRDAPFQLSYPVWIALSERVILPGKGSGFTLTGDPLDRTVAGTRITRTVSLENGVATARSSFQRLQPEIAADEARRAEAALKEVNGNEAALRSPPDYHMGEAEKKALLATVPADAEEFNQRGYDLMQAGSVAKALADFEKAAALSPDWARPAANRAVALIHMQKYDEAKAAIEQARRLDPDDFVVHQATGFLHAEQGRPADAIAALTRSLEIEPGNAFSLKKRAAALEWTGRSREALADFESILEREPVDQWALWETARIHAALGNGAAALAAADRLVAAETDNPMYLGYRAKLMKRFGRADEAPAEFDRALVAIDEALASGKHDRKMLLAQRVVTLSVAGRHADAVAEADKALKLQFDHVALLTARCYARLAGAIDLSKALKDCDAAVRYDPGNLVARNGRGLANLMLERWDAAIADYEAALEEEPRHNAALHGRGIARLRKGDRAGGERDIATARQRGYDPWLDFDALGVKS